MVHSTAMKYIRLGRWIAVVFSCVHIANCSVITVDNRGYKGILVAIHNTVPEDEDLINNLKVLFTKASEFLHNSTKNQVHFKEVTIAIPSSWPWKPEYEALPGNFFSSAHVRVDHANPEYGDIPYTLQTGGCGEPGQYIHLTPRFVRELEGETKEIFGMPERQLIHEWAHLRYGVFDEYGSPGDLRYPMFYIEKGKVRPSSCIRNIRGWIQNRDGGPCSILPGGQVNKECMFIPDMRSREAKASIMYMPFIPSMEGFCDGTEHREHNMKAPTKHNTMCNYESTWSVISRHEDFQSRRVTRDVAVDFEPIFRLIQPPSDQRGRYVLALDVSGSMNGRPMKLLHRAATRLIEDRIPDGAYLGIVQFSTEAHVLHGLTRVDNRTRMELSRSLPSVDDGGRTAIGKGIQEAIKVLEEGNVPPEAGLIILITDGEENVLPLISDIVPEIMIAKVVINAVAFGAEASEKLENITILTGGKGYFFANINGSRPSSALDSAFLESVTSQTDVDLQPVQLKDEMVELHQETLEKQVRIDPDLGKNTVFTVTSPFIIKVEVSLMSPTGMIYDYTSPEYSRDDDQKERIQIFLPQAETGRWRILFTRRGYYPVVAAFSVTSEPQDTQQQPIRVRSWLSDMQLKFPAHAKVYAEVHKGYRPVIEATVVATVDRPMGGAVDVTLRDDGVGADVTKDDGVYTGYFTLFNGNGRYAVVANVLNDGQAKLKHGSRSSGAQPVPKPKGSLNNTEPAKEFSIAELIPENWNATGDDDTENDVTGEPAPEFDRMSDAGAFRLDDWEPEETDIIPPGDIMDLVVLYSYENYDTNTTEVTLQWTSPGDDLDSGNVSSLELWASADIDTFFNDVHDAILVQDINITNGTLEPLAPGLLQQVTVLLQFPNASDTIYLAMKGKDEAGNTSPKYNVAAVHVSVKKQVEETLNLQRELLEINQTYSVNDTEYDVDIENIEDYSTEIWISAMVCYILLIVILVIIMARSTKKESKYPVKRQSKEQEL